MTEIEETIYGDSLPGNTLAMAERLKKLLKENDTNFLSPKLLKQDKRLRELLWLINQQAFGQWGKIDLEKEWSELNDEREASA